MTSKKNIQHEINDIIDQYHLFAERVSNNNHFLQGVFLESEHIKFYVRNMARGILSGELVFCLASLDIHPDFQNQGVLKNILEHIKNNPFDFKEIEVENIQSERLYHFFLKQNFNNSYDFDGFPKTVFIKI